MRKTYLGWGILTLVLAGVYLLLRPSKAGSPEEEAALAQGRTIITYWDRHSGHEHEARRTLIDEFNQSQDEVYVRALPIGYNALMEKLLTSIAGGSPPDVCALDSTMLAQLAAQGCFDPVDDLIASDPGLATDKFFPHALNTVSIDGHIYGIPTTQDTYALLWNKDAFRKAGLDPDRPPQTLRELEEYAAKLTIRDDSGFKQIGFLPWQPWDHSMKLGRVFGGRWYDPQTDRIVCADDPRILESFRWQQTWALDPGSDANPPYAMDPTRVQTFSKNFGAYMSANNPFYTGKLAMIIEGEWQCTFIPRYAPNLDWGVAPLPAPEGAEPIAWSPATIADCVPRGCRNREAAYAFLRWFHSPRPDGKPSPASDYNYAIHNLPVRPAEALEPRFVGDPKFKVFVDLLMNRKVVGGPVMPVAQFLSDEVERQRERVTMREASPEKALRELQDAINAELVRTREFLARAQSREDAS